MNNRLNYSKTESSLPITEIISNCKCLQALRIILLTNSKPKKFLVTLKPKVPKSNGPTSMKSEIRKVDIKEEEDVKQTYVFDTRFTQTRAEKIAEKSEIQNKDKNLQQLASAVFRLTGGWGLAKPENRRKRSKDKPESKTKSNKKESGEESKQEDLKTEKKTESIFELSTDEVETNASKNNWKRDHGNESLAANQSQFSEQSEIENVPLPSKKDHIQPSSALDQPSVVDNKVEVKKSKSKKETSDATNHWPKSLTPTEVTTSSFLENAVEETKTFSSNKSHLNNWTPFHGDSYAVRAQSGKSDMNNILPADDEICQRIFVLEEQVAQINFELTQLQKVLTLGDDFANFNTLLKRFNAVTNLLMETKDTCLKMQRMEMQLSQGRHTNLNEEEEIVTHNCEDRLFGQQMHLKPFNCDVQESLPINITKVKSNVPPENCTCTCNCLKYPQNLQQYKPKSTNITSENNIPQANLQQTITPKAEDLRNALNDGSISPNIYPPTMSTHRPISGTNDNSKPSVFIPYQHEPVSSSKGENRNNISQSSNANEENPSVSTPNSHKARTSAGTDVTRDFSCKEQKTNTDDCISNSSLSDTMSSTYGELPLTTRNLSKTLWQIIGNVKSKNVVVTVFPEPNSVYFINVSHIQTGKCLGYIRTNEAAFLQAKEEKLFDDFLLFIVLNLENTMEQKNKILSHSFEYISVPDSDIN